MGRGVSYVWQIRWGSIQFGNPNTPDASLFTPTGRGAETRHVIDRAWTLEPMAGIHGAPQPLRLPPGPGFGPRSSSWLVN